MSSDSNVFGQAPAERRSHCACRVTFSAGRTFGKLRVHLGIQLHPPHSGHTATAQLLQPCLLTPNQQSVGVNCLYNMTKATVVTQDTIEEPVDVFMLPKIKD